MEFKIGILGGGQLSRMLAEAARKLNQSCLIYTERDDDPAALVGTPVHRGTLNDEQSLHRFFSRVEIVVFENEFVDVHQLRRLTENTHLHFRPELDAIQCLQNKLNQKNLLTQLDIPTSHFQSLPDEGEIGLWLNQVQKSFPTGAVLKWSMHGYDGKGVLVLKNWATQSDEAGAFCRQARDHGDTVYAEEYIPFQKELSLVTCRRIRPKEQFGFYPLTVSEQVDGICRWAYGPARNEVPKGLEPAAHEYAQRLARHLHLEGTFALEFFLTVDGRLLVNEIAPRVHNTGHFTLLASATSQFENHLRACLDLPLGSTETPESYLMLNLIGPPGVSLEIFPREGQELLDQLCPKAFQPYWYGKRGVREKRKLGHINARCKTYADVLKLKSQLSNINERWLQELHAKETKKQN